MDEERTVTRQIEAGGVVGKIGLISCSDGRGEAIGGVVTLFCHSPPFTARYELSIENKDYLLRLKIYHAESGELT